jgi:hypothetical protein
MMSVEYTAIGGIGVVLTEENIETIKSSVVYLQNAGGTSASAWRSCS